MHILPADSASFSTFDIQHSTFIYPTDTCYGIGCSVFDEAALKRVYAAKGRDFAKPVNIMVDSLEMLERFGELSPTARKLAEAFLPGDFTLLVPRTNQLQAFINPGQNLIGIRIPAHAFCLSLVKTIGAPVITTSANVAGEPETYSVPDIFKAFGQSNPNTDLVFDGGILTKNPPSTIVKVIGGTWEIIRQGRIKGAIIQGALG